ncbi:hypothetical protein CHELA1G2_13767 [Hyphomicrobiales bacterium]|nr:hypothetical protein CHELA1G2_13767 [Hyphomicrobiales bacterium]
MARHLSGVRHRSWDRLAEHGTSGKDAAGHGRPRLNEAAPGEWVEASAQGALPDSLVSLAAVAVFDHHTVGKAAPPKYGIVLGWSKRSQRAVSSFMK